MAFRDPHRPRDRDVLERMTEIVHHRGPDGGGLHVEPGIGLGMRRLAIVDLETGDQPIANEDGSLAIVCNGEISNFVELRRELLSRGHRLRTGSDIEVILHLYEEMGPACLSRLRGMFGLALWDAPRRRLMLARDRFGIKPLHYTLRGDALYFGSEQKSILGADVVERDLDLPALREMFTLGLSAARARCSRTFARCPRPTTCSTSEVRPEGFTSPA